MIPNEVIERVRRAADALALIGEHIRLEQRGSGYVGACPFHAGGVPSFTVYPAERRYVCFGCGARGDVFDFLCRATGRPFGVVVREVAARVRIAVPRDRPGAADGGRDERAELLGACEAATVHWQKRLRGPEGEPGRAYLAARGIDAAAVVAFRLGYAPDGWHDLQSALCRAGVSSEVQHAAGLLAAKDGPRRKLYDRFRGRVIFPVSDARGRVIGFGGRAIADEAGAKYLNTPETLLYKKSRALFGLNWAAQAIRKTGRALLVEGYFDAVAMHQAGFESTVAPCGTVVTLDQLALLSSVGCREVVLLFDGDEAGHEAPLRAAAVMLKVGLAVRVARCPRVAEDDSDPARILKDRGRSEVRETLEAAQPLTEFLIAEAIERHGGEGGARASVEETLQVVRELMPHVLATPEGLMRTKFERAIAHRLDVHIGSLRAAVQREAANRSSG